MKKFNTTLCAEKDFFGNITRWSFEIYDRETYETLYKSDAYYKSDEAKEAMDIVLKNLSNEDWIKWKMNLDGTAWRGCEEGGIRQLLIRPAVVCREELGSTASEKVWGVFKTEEECREFIKDFVKKRLKNNYEGDK